MTAAESVSHALENGLGQALEELEQTRRRVQDRNRTAILRVTVLTLTGMGVLFTANMHWFWYLLVVVAGIIAGVRCTGNDGVPGAYAYKELIVPELLQNSLPGFSYSAGGCISVQEFEESGLFITTDTYTGQDCFSGCIGRTGFHFSLVHAQQHYQETITDTDDDGNITFHIEDRWRDIFKGLLFVADFNKHFNGRTLVLANRTGSPDSLVKLEDPRFNRCFQVYASDQMEARYLLTPRMMERLVELQEYIGGFEVSFSGSRIYVAAGGFPFDAFDPDVRKSYADREQLPRILGWIFTVSGIVDRLDLNTRIWGKE